MGQSYFQCPTSQLLRNIIVLYLHNPKANQNHISVKVLMAEGSQDAIFNPMILESIKPLVLIIIFKFPPLLYVDRGIESCSSDYRIVFILITSSYPLFLFNF